MIPCARQEKELKTELIWLFWCTLGHLNPRETFHVPTVAGMVCFFVKDRCTNWAGIVCLFVKDRCTNVVGIVCLFVCLFVIINIYYIYYIMENL